MCGDGCCIADSCIATVMYADKSESGGKWLEGNMFLFDLQCTISSVYFGFTSEKQTVTKHQFQFNFKDLKCFALSLSLMLATLTICNFIT